jgi:hypothetical protein
MRRGDRFQASFPHAHMVAGHYDRGISPPDWLSWTQIAITSAGTSLCLGLADFAEILGQLRLQIEQLLPLREVELDVCRAFGPGGRLHERATLQVQILEDL